MPVFLPLILTPGFVFTYASVLIVSLDNWGAGTRSILFRFTIQIEPSIEGVKLVYFT